MPQLFTNNATSTLAGGISDSALSLTVESGHGARFPNPGAGEWFVVTLEKSDGTREIVKVTARATDTFTIERAQEGTTAVAFSGGDAVELRVTAAVMTRYESVAMPDRRARMVNASTFNLSTTGAWTAIPFDSEQYDTGGLHSLVTNTERVTASMAGLYMLSGALANSIATSGFVLLGLRKNGTTFLAEQFVAPGGNGLGIAVQAQEYLELGDYVELMYYVSATTSVPAGRAQFSATLASSGVALTATGAMREIASVVTSGSQSSVTFGSIPGTYRDLKVVVFARGTAATTGVTLGARFNGDTGANYDFVRESRFGQASGFATTRADAGAIVAATAVADNYTHCEIDIPGYALNGPHKTLTARQPIKQANALGNVFNEDGEGFWRSGAPITSIELAVGSGGFVDGSVVVLYGVGGEPSVITGETVSATVNTEESTSSTSYTDLATAGPSVSLVTGTEVLVTLSAYAYASLAGPYAYISVEVSGATTRAANASNAASTRAPGDAYVIPLSRTFKISGLTPGMNTFTMKYRVSANSHLFGNRDITVQAL